MTQKTSRRKRARIRKRRKVARCIPSRNSSPRSNSRRSNPFSSNKQRPSSTGRRKCRVRLSSRRRRRSPHGDTGWISSVARRRLSGKTIKVSLSIGTLFHPRRTPRRFPRCFRARANPKNIQVILIVNGRSRYRLIIPASASSSSSSSSFPMPQNIHRVSDVNLPKKTIKTIVFPRVSSRRVTFSQKNSKSRKLFDKGKD